MAASDPTCGYTIPLKNNSHELRITERNQAIAECQIPSAIDTLMGALSAECQSTTYPQYQTAADLSFWICGAQSEYKFNVQGICANGKCTDYVITATPVDTLSGSKNFRSTSDNTIHFETAAPKFAPFSFRECHALPGTQ